MRNAVSNPPWDYPVFNQGFNRNVAQIPLPTNLNDLRQVALGSYSNNPPKNVQYFFPLDANNRIAGGLYFPQNVPLELISQGNKQIVRTKINVPNGFYGTKTVVADFEFDYDNRTTTVRNKTDNVVLETYNSLPNGTIYVNGQITSLSGTVQKDSRLTIAAKSNIVINNHLLYEEDPRQKPGAKNILAVLTETGSVIVPNNAPLNLNVFATIMALQGSFRLENILAVTGNRGKMTVYGGIIQKHFGYLGEPDYCYNRIYGYSQHIIYDPRANNVDTAPLGIPKTNTLTWQTSREDGIDSLDLVVWKKR